MVKQSGLSNDFIARLKSANSEEEAIDQYQFHLKSIEAFAFSQREEAWEMLSRRIFEICEGKYYEKLSSQ